ncbi:hypothetical protein BSKO_00837 [Bryopsis sp. KO-2023]|nr:hypothetical protein BSKO_00837 [Bryopsis sp. KO-2023]
MSLGCVVFPGSSRSLVAGVCHHQSRLRRNGRRAGSVSRSAGGESTGAELDVAARKNALRELVGGTSRGSKADSTTRGRIAEAQVAVETASAHVDFEKLAGTWDLIYTTALDVLPILFLGASPTIGGIPLPSPVKIGRISQKFSSPEEGIIENIISYSVPGLIEDEGVITTVTARYEVLTSKRVYLKFEKAGISDIKISPGLESLIAPAMLPRGDWSRQILMGIQEFAFSIPLNRETPFFPSAREGGNYLLTYLDEDMLIGRASGTGGAFIFNRREST